MQNNTQFQILAYRFSKDWQKKPFADKNHGFERSASIFCSKKCLKCEDPFLGQTP